MGKFVVIEGLIGAGKTTLAKLLGEAWGAKLVLEPNAFNPFLEPFYKNPTRFAFPVQMFYLITRWRQQEGMRQLDLFTDRVVSDYLFAKDRLFAEKTLDPLELELYDRFAGAFGERCPTPDLVVFLEAPIEVLMARIAERRAPGETAIEASYLVDLRDRYYRLLENWQACPLLLLDNRDMNYRDDPVARRAVIDRIEAALAGDLTSQAPGSSDREAQPSLFGGI